MAKRLLTFTPEDADCAARFMARCTELAGAGLDVSVRLAPDASGGGAKRERVQSENDLESVASGGIDIEVSFSGLSGVLEVSAPDMLIRAKGGTPLSAVAAAAEESLLWFPYGDDSAEGGRTVGSLLAEAPVLPFTESLGGLREYVLALEMVTGGGERVRFGSRAVKDVAGYEVIGLLVGGGRRFGMITEATLRLIPRPAVEIGVRDVPSGGAAQVLGPLDDLTERVRRVFDPAGILR